MFLSTSSVLISKAEAHPASPNGIRDLDAEMNTRFAEINHRFDDLKDWIRSEVKRLEDRIERIEHAVAKG